MLKTPRTIAAGIAAVAVIGTGALLAGSAAQAAPTSTTPAAPGATVKTITLCVSAPAHDTFKQSRVEAWSWQRNVYSLDSVQVTNRAGCGTVVLGSTLTGHLRFVRRSTVRC